MTDVGFSFRRWLGAVCTLSLLAALALPLAGTGCGSSSGGGTGGSSASHAASSGSNGGAPASTTAPSSTTTLSTGGSLSTSASSSSGAGGVSGTGGSASGAGGTGGTGGSFVPPVGTAQYPAEVEPNNTDAQANPLAAGTLGFTASIWPLGDVDDFTFDVTVPHSNVAVSTSDGMGGCPMGAHTYLRISDANENVLAVASGAAGCVSFTPVGTPSLVGLPLGTYHVHVESTSISIIPFYVLSIQITSPSCGDGIVEVVTDEQCDHGATNGMNGDGCSASCQILSGNYVNETEPDDSFAMANDIDGHAGAVGQINPGTDVDYYSVDVTIANSSITAVVGDGFGACPAMFDSKLTLYDASMTVLVTDKTGGVSPCSEISPLVYPQAANLQVGKYYLEVQRISTQVQSFYVLGVTVAPPTCGDGVVSPGEQCDPGPVTVPGCTPTCQLNGNYIAEVEPNGSPTQANALGAHTGFLASIGSPGDVDYFSFQVPGPSSMVFLQVGDGIGGCPAGFDSTLYLYGPNKMEIISDDNGGPGACSRISPLLYNAAMNLTAGTYYARVDFTGDNTAGPPYVLSIAVYNPGCGDGFLESGEQCDDGALNGTAGDGCTSGCMSLAPWEIEPNDSTANATPLWSGFSTWKGAIEPIGDLDYYKFTLASAGSVTLTTHDVDKPTYCTSDTLLTLYDHVGNLVTSNDDGGPGPGDPLTQGKCSQIANQAVPAGNYFVLVQRLDNEKIIPAYQLDLVVQ